MESNTKVIVGGRNHAIDLMKFFAAILITNSHMMEVYPDRFQSLAFGGAIGDSLFFFCAGFLVMVGRNSQNFFNWYKRRVNRIFPAIFAVAILSIVFFGKNPTLKGTILNGGGWFVQAIFLFYAIFWFIRRFMSEKMWIPVVLDVAIILIWFVFFWNYDDFLLGGALYMRFPVFFLMMLFGAILSKMMKDNKTNRELPLWLLLIAVVGSIALYYGYIYLQGRIPVLKTMQVILVVMHLLMVYSFYLFCSNRKVIKLYQNRYINWFVYGLSACCLEVYLTGGWAFGLGESLKGVFPLNILLTFNLIFIIAYVVKVFGNFLSQTFKTEDYDWKGMVKL